MKIRRVIVSRFNELCTLLTFQGFEKADDKWNAKFSNNVTLVLNQAEYDRCSAIAGVK